MTRTEVWWDHRFGEPSIEDGMKFSAAVRAHGTRGTGWLERATGWATEHRPVALEWPTPDAMMTHARRTRCEGTRPAEEFLDAMTAHPQRTLAAIAAHEHLLTPRQLVSALQRNEGCWGLYGQDGILVAQYKLGAVPGELRRAWGVYRGVERAQWEAEYPDHPLPPEVIADEFPVDFRQVA